MKYIELMGIPGSGKTTVAKDVIDILEPRYHSILTRWDVKPRLLQTMIRKQAAFIWRPLTWCLYGRNSTLSNFLWGLFRYTFLLRFIRYNAGLLPHVVNNADRLLSSPEVPHQFLSPEKLISWFFEVACIYQAAQETLSQYNVLLMEEGFCQQTYYLITAFRESDQCSQFLEDYVKTIPKPDFVIMLSADPARCEQRLQTRATGIPSEILQLFTPDERIALFEQRWKTYQEVALYLEAHEVPVIRIDNNQPYRVTRKLLEHALIGL